jgi:hypothetical protein
LLRHFFWLTNVTNHQNKKIIYTIIPSAIPVIIDIPRISFILLLKKKTVLNIAIIAASNISKAPISDNKYVIPVNAAVTPNVISPNFIISSLE